MDYYDRSVVQAVATPCKTPSALPAGIGAPEMQRQGFDDRRQASQDLKWIRIIGWDESQRL